MKALAFYPSNLLRRETIVIFLVHAIPDFQDI